MLRGERLPFATSAELCAQVADALDHAQRYSIVHRDVKPANIMVDAWGRAKLTDFGVAHVPASSMTQTGATLGSPKYMSPEQVLGLAADPRADLFSLGIVLFEMLTGRHPFVQANDTVFSLMHRIAGVPHAPLRQVDPGIPAGFERIIERALAKKPEQRYQRAAEMASDLRNYKAAADPGATRTLVAPFPASPLAPAVASTSTPTAVNLLEELDKFDATFDREQQARAAAEEAAIERRRKERDATPEAWRLPELDKTAGERKADTTHARPGAPPAVNPKRMATLDLLKSQAPAPVADNAGAQRLREVLAIDAHMREADRYLSEVAAQINKVGPRTERPYEFRFFGKVVPTMLSQAEVRSTPARVADREVCRVIKFVYRAGPAQPFGVSLQGDEILRCFEFLKAHKAEYETAVERKNDFGVTTRAKVTLKGALPCEVTITADYENPGAGFELSGVRRPERYYGEVDPDEIEETIDELVRYLLGAEDGFEQYIRRS
jgi:enamine deaminase RidA (YjgF/YER057c/UK114 family)